MRRRFRYPLGLLVGLFFVIIGARRRALARYNSEGIILPIFGHSPKPEVLNSLLCWLRKNGFVFVSTDDVLEMREGRGKWQPKTAWLSFDDGLCGFDSELLPILEKYNVPATVFIAPEEIKRGRIWSATVAKLLSDEKRRELFSVPTRERYSVVDGLRSVDSLPKQLMSLDAISRISKHPLITIENHTNSHMGCSFQSIESMAADVLQANEEILKLTGRRPRLMCYPYGFRTRLHDEEVRRLGLIPVASFPGCLHAKDELICRNMFVDNMGNIENTCRILGAWLKVGQMK